MQFLINQWHEFSDGFGVALLDPIENPSDVAHAPTFIKKLLAREAENQALQRRGGHAHPRRFAISGLLALLALPNGSQMPNTIRCPI